MAYKYKLSEMSKTASEEEAAKELKRKPGEKFKVGQVTYSDDGTSKSTITDIDPETGAVRWRIDQLPGFDKLYDEITDLVTTAKRTYVKTKDDKKFREFYDDIRVIRNKIRTHLRNEYPDQYKRIVRVSENEVDEISTSGAAGSYLTPYAFRKKGQKANDKAYKELGYEEVNELLKGFNPGEKYYLPDDGYMAAKLRAEDNWYTPYEGTDADGETTADRAEFVIKNQMGIKDPERIKKFIDGWEKYTREVLDGTTKLVQPEPDPNRFFQKKRRSNPGKNPRYGKKTNALIQKLKAKRGINEVVDLVHVYDKDGKIFGTGEIEKELPNDKVRVRFDGNFVGTFRADRVKPVQEGVGADLGPGPKAGPDGVTDSAYTKQFKYKLVPKTKDGTYVQKGSGMIVKNLF